MNETPHMAPGPLVPGPPGPNGFTRTVRRMMSAGAGLTFFGLLIADVLTLIREVPFQIYVLLAVMALFATQTSVDLLEKLLRLRQ